MYTQNKCHGSFEIYYIKKIITHYAVTKSMILLHNDYPVAFLYLAYPCLIASARAFEFSSCIAVLQRDTALEAAFPTAEINMITTR